MMQVGIHDISNCTWTNFTECALESQFRCSRFKTLEVVPIQNQTDEFDGKIPCNGQAGRKDYETCSDGLCPAWMVGNWTDCSSTCNQTRAPWEGIQSRDVTCIDASGILYSRDVCQKLYGVALAPASERPCECSHMPPPPKPYSVRYVAVSL